MSKAVLGLFDNEDELRDHLAKDLTIIEPELVLIGMNFIVDNPIGSGGAFDILARKAKSVPATLILNSSIKGSEGALPRRAV